jgi:hypothetical protein
VKKEGGTLAWRCNDKGCNKVEPGKPPNKPPALFKSTTEKGKGFQLQSDIVRVACDHAAGVGGGAESGEPASVAASSALA